MLCFPHLGGRSCRWRGVSSALAAFGLYLDAYRLPAPGLGVVGIRRAFGSRPRHLCGCAALWRRGALTCRAVVMAGPERGAAESIPIGDAPGRCAGVLSAHRTRDPSDLPIGGDEGGAAPADGRWPRSFEPSDPVPKLETTPVVLRFPGLRPQNLGWFDMHDHRKASEMSDGQKGC